MAHYIQYSNEHIHILEYGVEDCYLSRNWNRCTAECDHKVEDADGECELGKTAYYNGDEWVFWNGEEFVEAEQNDEGGRYIKLSDGSYTEVDE